MRKARKDKIYYGLKSNDCCAYKRTYIYATKSERLRAHKELGNDFHYVNGTAQDFLESWRTGYEHDDIETQLKYEHNAIK